MITVNFVIYTRDGVWTFLAMPCAYCNTDNKQIMQSSQLGNNMAKQFITMLC